MFQLKGMLNMTRLNKNPSTTNVNGWHRAKPLSDLRLGIGAFQNVTNIPSLPSVMIQKDFFGGSRLICSTVKDLFAFSYEM